MTQRWLSLIGICEVLSTTERHIKWLVKNGYLEMIPAKNKAYAAARYLDPTPEYARRLKVGETLYSRRQVIPEELDLPNASLFTIREISEITDKTVERTRKFVTEKKLSSYKANSRLLLFSARQVRDILWRSGDRLKASRRAPFLLTELIEYFSRYEAAQREMVPTDAEFAEDDKMLKKWELLARMDPADRNFAMQEFLEKVRIAREIVTAAREDRRSD